MAYQHILSSKVGSDNSDFYLQHLWIQFILGFQILKITLLKLILINNKINLIFNLPDIKQWLVSFNDIRNF